MLAALTVLVPVPAAADDDLSLSRDGVSWSDRLDDALFDQDFVWVPGDVETASFYIRNDHPDDGMLSVEVVTPDDRDRLMVDEEMSIEARSAAGPWVRLRREGATHRISSRALPPGEGAQVDVRVAFDPAATNQTMLGSLRAAFVVTLTDARGGGSAPVQVVIHTRVRGQASLMNLSAAAGR